MQSLLKKTYDLLKNLADEWLDQKYLHVIFSMIASC